MTLEDEMRQLLTRMALLQYGDKPPLSSVKLVAPDNSAPRRANDRGHGSEGVTSMQNERTACACGCGETANPGYRYIFGHHGRRGPYYRVDDETGCWIWLGAKDRKGYGQISRDGRLNRAPRYFYQQAKGRIPNGLEIDHLCHNKSCVNPDHLEAVTAATNSQRRRNTKLSWDDVREIRASGLGCAEIARRWGICESNASMVLRGQTWKETA